MAKKRASKRKPILSFQNAMLFLLFLAVVGIVKTLVTDTEFSVETTTPADRQERNPLENDGEVVLDTLTAGTIGIIEKEHVQELKLDELEEMDYEEIKGQLGVENDFCLYFEDVDGNLVTVNGKNSVIGDDSIFVNGVPCR